MHGFQAASLSRILQHCRVTKGALYHHFPNKQALGLAVLDEIIQQEMSDSWITPLQQTNDPINQIKKMIKAAGQDIDMDFIMRGCPLNNLAQEMSPIDETFRGRIDVIYRQWRQSWAAALRRGQQAAMVRQDIDAEGTATFLIAALEGCIGMAKNAQSMPLLTSCMAGLMNTLDTLAAN